MPLIRNQTDAVPRRAARDVAWLGGSAAAVAALALVLPAATAGATVARASSGGGSVQGTVAAVDASAKSFTVKTSSGSTVTVKVTTATSYRDSLVSSPSFADVKAGDSIAVIGTSSGGVETALIVIVGGSGSSSGSGGSAPGGPGGAGGPGGFRNGTFGTVASVDRSADTFTVKTAQGSTVKVKVTSSTTYRDRSASSAGFADVKAGQSVVVVGSTSDGVQHATSVVVGGFGGPGDAGRFGGGTFGTVASVDRSADTFTVKTAQGSTVKVKVTSSTTYRDTSVAKASFADVKAAQTVAVTGSTSNGVETAKTVSIGRFGGPGGTGAGRFGGFGGGTFGTVASVDRSADTFTVKTAQGSTVTVKVTSSTTYRDTSVAKPGFAEVKSGARVGVLGTTSKGVVTARSVILGIPSQPTTTSGG